MGHMIATSGLYFAILFMMEYRVFKRITHCIQRISKAKLTLPPNVFIDEDVDEEKRKVGDMSWEEMFSNDLVVKSLSKSYDKLWAVNQISVAIKR